MSHWEERSSRSYVVTCDLHKSLFAKFDKSNDLVVDSRDNYINKMMDILDDTAKFKHYMQSSRSDENPFILVEERFN